MRVFKIIWFVFYIPSKGIRQRKHRTYIYVTICLHKRYIATCNDVCSVLSLSHSLSLLYRTNFLITNLLKKSSRDWMDIVTWREQHTTYNIVLVCSFHTLKHLSYKFVNDQILLSGCLHVHWINNHLMLLRYIFIFIPFFPSSILP